MNNATKVTTGKVRLSYAKLLKPEAMEEGGVPKYSTALIIRKDDTLTLDRINAAVAHLEEEFKAKNKGKLPAKWKTPLRDGDLEKEDDPNYAGCMFLNCSSKQKPAVVSLERGEDGKFKPITSEEEVYSGMYARVSLNFFTFDTNGNRGIAAGLNNVQKIADGEKLAGSSRPEDDFDEEFELEEDML